MLPAPKGGSRVVGVAVLVLDVVVASMLPAPKGGSRRTTAQLLSEVLASFNAARPEGRESGLRREPLGQ